MNKSIKSLARAKAKAKKGNGDRQVPLGYVERVRDEYGESRIFTQSGKNVMYRPGKDRVYGSNEGPINAYQDYNGEKGIGKIKFTRHPWERYDTMYRNRH